MFRNLLSNALKFTPSEGTVAVRIGIDNFTLSVEVQDSGVGISAENQRRLFNEVVQFHAKAHQGGGGSGLGLWISKKIVDMHGGSIGVRSEGEGKGSTFNFTLPIARRAEVHDINDAETGSSNPNASESWQEDAAASGGVGIVEENATALEKDDEVLRLDSLSVLVVDDSALNRKLLVKRLERQGYSVFEAGDGDVAVEFINGALKGENTMIDVITMDDVSEAMPI